MVVEKVEGVTRSKNLWSQQDFMDYIYHESYMEYVPMFSKIRIWI